MNEATHMHRNTKSDENNLNNTQESANTAKHTETPTITIIPLDEEIKRAQSVITITPKYNIFRKDRSHSIPPENTPPTFFSPIASRVLSPITSRVSPITSRVYNCTTLHELLVTSTIDSKQRITSYPAIPSEQMILDDVTEID